MLNLFLLSGELLEIEDGYFLLMTRITKKKRLAIYYDDKQIHEKLLNNLNRIIHVKGEMFYAENSNGFRLMAKDIIITERN